MTTRPFSVLSRLFPRSTPATPLAMAELDRRLRADADVARAALPDGLPRRTLDALQDASPRSASPWIVAPASMLAATLAFATLLALTGVLSNTVSGPMVANHTITPADESPLTIADEPVAVVALKPFTPWEWVDRSVQGPKALSDPLATEARLLIQDARGMANAMLSSLPQRFRSTTTERDVTYHQER